MLFPRPALRKIGSTGRIPVGCSAGILPAVRRASRPPTLDLRQAVTAVGVFAEGEDALGTAGRMPALHPRLSIGAIGTRPFIMTFELFGRMLSSAGSTHASHAAETNRRSAEHLA